jgi:hypothetical protein
MAKTFDYSACRADLKSVPTERDRLRELEKEIREGVATFYHVGVKLKEIHDNYLYKADGFDTWQSYCRERWEWTAERARQLIVASEYREALPAPPATSEAPTNCWSEGTVRELARLGSKRDAARVAAKVVEAVEQSKARANGDPAARPLKLTQATVRKFVDEDLGVNRAAKARETKRRREEASRPELNPYLLDMAGRLEVETEKLATVNDDGWLHFNREHPRALERLLAACEALAALLRRAKAAPPTGTVQDGRGGGEAG